MSTEEMTTSEPESEVVSVEEPVEVHVPAERDLPGWLRWLSRPERKIAIVGFTMSRQEAPWDDPTFEIWLCNNLWKYTPDKWHRLYDLHDDKTMETSAGASEHMAFLAGEKSKAEDGSLRHIGDRPTYCWKPRENWPTAILFPREEINAAFGRYFSNSISWMIAHAIYEGATEVHVYGVDMAQGTEYANQRPSCEYFLGFAAGRGCKVYIPPTSDLLKVSAMYGAESDEALRIKLEQREKELNERLNILQQQNSQITAQINQILGAKENTAYFKAVWTNPRANRDGQAKEPVGV